MYFLKDEKTANIFHQFSIVYIHISKSCFRAHRLPFKLLPSRQLIQMTQKILSDYLKYVGIIRIFFASGVQWFK